MRGRSENYDDRLKFMDWSEMHMPFQRSFSRTSRAVAPYLCIFAAVTLIAHLRSPVERLQLASVPESSSAFTGGSIASAMGRSSHAVRQGQGSSRARSTIEGPVLKGKSNSNQASPSFHRRKHDNDLTETLRALRHELRVKEGKSRMLRQQEPWRSRQKLNLFRYGTASAIRYPGDDDRHYHNEWHFDYEAPEYTGQYDDTAKHDQFTPDEPWNKRTRSITLDGTFADLKQACEKAGKHHTWDTTRHECLYDGTPPLPELPRGRGVTQEGPSRQALDGSPIAGEACEGDDVDEFGACRPQLEGEVDQYGWRPGDVRRNGYKNPYDPLSATQRRGTRERDTVLDYQTADLEKACRRQMKKPVIGTLYSWDAWHARCLYYGKPARYKRRAPETSHSLTDGKYWDMREECLRRGPGYSYRYPWRDGEPGQCLHMGHIAVQTQKDPKYGPLDYLRMDLRNMCEARGWIWSKGRCGPKALTKSSSDDEAKKFEKMQGTVSQYGWHAPQRPLPAPNETPVEGFPAHQTVDPALIHDYVVECARMDGVIKYMGHKVFCLSHDGCTVADQNGAKFDCKEAGLENLYGSIDVSKTPGLPVDKFNPGGSVSARWRRDKSTPAWLANSEDALSFENVDLHGKDLDPYASSVSQPMSSGRGAVGSRAGKGERGGQGPLRLGDSGRPIPLNGERGRPWRSTPLRGKHAEASKDADDPGGSDEDDCPGEVDQYGWYPPAKPCATRKTGMVQKMPGGGLEGGWTSGFNGKAKYYYNHYTNRIAWKGPAKLPYECTEDDNGAGTVPYCDWSEDVDLATGERYWKNNITGVRTWQNPFSDPQVRPRLQPTSRKGTWSGAPGGNKYWTPEFTRALLGASTAVFNPAARGRGNCGGATGMCLGNDLEGTGQPGDTSTITLFDPHPSTTPKTRGRYGAKWDHYDDDLRKMSKGGSIHTQETPQLEFKNGVLTQVDHAFESS